MNYKALFKTIFIFIVFTVIFGLMVFFDILALIIMLLAIFTGVYFFIDELEKSK